MPLPMPRFSISVSITSASFCPPLTAALPVANRSLYTACTIPSFYLCQSSLPSGFLPFRASLESFSIFPHPPFFLKQKWKLLFICVCVCVLNNLYLQYCCRCSFSLSLQFHLMLTWGKKIRFFFKICWETNGKNAGNPCVVALELCLALRHILYRSYLIEGSWRPWEGD